MSNLLQTIQILAAILIGAGFVYLGFTDTNTGAGFGYMAIGVVIMASSIIVWLGEE